MRLRFKSMLGIILILIIFCFAIGIGYMFYNELSADSELVVDGEITINYLSGKNFKSNKDNEVEFSVTNNDDSQKYYYISFTNVSAKDVSYELKSSNNLDISNDLKSDIISNQIIINGNETVNYTLKFTNKGNDTYSGTIQVGLKTNEENTFSDVILANNNVSDSPLTQIGTSAVLNEGLFKTEDDLGIAYYFRGAVTNNNVYFADNYWKIVKINGDGSIKLVLNNILEEISKYYDIATDFVDSPIDQKLNAWYNNNLNSYSSYIAYYKFCNDTVFENNSSTYIAYSRIITNNIPTFVCLGNSSNAKIGLLTADEVMLAGGSTNENKNYYLYNENIKTAYYTMTSSTISDTYRPFVVDTNGALLTEVSGSLLRGIRPVINIIKTARVTGTGTIDDPYQIIINQ